MSYSIGFTDDKNASKLLVPDVAAGTTDIAAVGFDVAAVAADAVVDDGGGNNDDAISVDGNLREGAFSCTGRS